MIESLIVGLILGLSAGFAPGPMLALVLSQTLKHGLREGLKVALVPLVSDAPIVGLALWISYSLTEHHRIVGLISLGGALFLVLLAVESFRTRPLGTTVGTATPHSVAKGLAVNLLNPHPYLFWLSVGGPILARTWPSSRWEAFLFLGGFYGSLVGSKVLLALIIVKSRRALTGAAYVWIMRVLGAVLLGFAILFAREGLRLLGLPA